MSHNSFSWSPKIKYTSSGGSSTERAEWDAKADFAGPAKTKPKSIDPWQKYAQVLLLANETMFVD